METKNINIKDEYITLGQLIKIVDLISSGGEAKTFLANNAITINNKEDNRRGRKLYKGDHIVILNKEYIIC